MLDTQMLSNLNATKTSRSPVAIAVAR